MAGIPHSGQLRHRVQIQRSSTSVEGDISWNTIKTANASIRAMRGRLISISNLTEVDSSTHEIVFRHFPHADDARQIGVTTADRLLEKGRIYTIQSVVDPGANQDGGWICVSATYAGNVVDVQFEGFAFEEQGIAIGGEGAAMKEAP